MQGQRRVGGRSAGHRPRHTGQDERAAIMTAIKICGIKNEEDALGAAEAGADFIGLVFASSPRQVTPAQAEKIATGLKKSRVKAETVGVFVNMPAPTVRKIADVCRLDWVQISGDEPWEYCLELSRPVIKVIRVSRNYQPEPVCKHLAYGCKMIGEQKHIFLLDSSAREKSGGGGMSFASKLSQTT